VFGSFRACRVGPAVSLRPVIAKMQRRKIRKAGWRSTTRPVASPQRVWIVSRSRSRPTLSIREALLERDKVSPKDWDIVCGSGHAFHLVTSHLRGRAALLRRVRFGAIGESLTTAIGVAAARNNGKVLLLQGDVDLI